MKKQTFNIKVKLKLQVKLSVSMLKFQSKSFKDMLEFQSWSFKCQFIPFFTICGIRANKLVLLA